MRDLTRQLDTRLRDFAKKEAGFEPRSGRAAVAIMVREGDAAHQVDLRGPVRRDHQRLDVAFHDGGSGDAAAAGEGVPGVDGHVESGVAEARTAPRRCAAKTPPGGFPS